MQRTACHADSSSYGTVVCCTLVLLAAQFLPVGVAADLRRILPTEYAVEDRSLVPDIHSAHPVAASPTRMQGGVPGIPSTPCAACYQTSTS